MYIAAWSDPSVVIATLKVDIWDDSMLLSTSLYQHRSYLTFGSYFRDRKTSQMYETTITINIFAIFIKYFYGEW